MFPVIVLPKIDSEMKTIIDKLANFVARNGPEFEKMTMSKKSDDPKFAFLFGGEYNPYYRWKVEVEKSLSNSLCKYDCELMFFISFPVQAGVISASPSISQPTHHSSGNDICCLLGSFLKVVSFDSRAHSTRY